MKPLNNPEQRKRFGSVAGQEVPTFQMTCSAAILPNGNGTSRGRQVEYGETDANFNVYDLHNCNCILPYEKFEASFDQERGQWYPLGSRGLFRRVKATAEGTICTNVSCLIESEGQAFSQVEGQETCRVLTYETAINVWATRPITKDSIFWVTYQTDRDKPLLVEGVEPEIEAAAGRWIPIDKPSDREFLEFTCGRPYGNFEAANANTSSNPGINNIFPIWQIIRDNDNPEYDNGNFSNMAFGEIAGDQGTRNYGNTTDLPGEVWKNFKFDILTSTGPTQDRQYLPTAIKSHDVHGLQLLKKGLYLCNIQFVIVPSIICLDGDFSNSTNWPRIPLVDGSNEIIGIRRLFEQKDNQITNSMHLMDTSGHYVRTIQFMQRTFERSDLLFDSSTIEVNDILRFKELWVNHYFHFHITEEEVGSVLVHQLNTITYSDNLGRPTGPSDYPDFQHKFNPYVKNTNGTVRKSIMEFVDVELEDIGRVVPVRNPQPGTGDSDGGVGEVPGGGGI